MLFLSHTLYIIKSRSKIGRFHFESQAGYRIPVTKIYELNLHYMEIHIFSTQLAFSADVKLLLLTPKRFKNIRFETARYSEKVNHFINMQLNV